MGLFCQRKGFLLDVVLGLRIIGPEAKLGSLKRLTLPGGGWPLWSRPLYFNERLNPCLRSRPPTKKRLLLFPQTLGFPSLGFILLGKEASHDCSV